MVRKLIAYVVVLAVLLGGGWYVYTRYYAGPPKTAAGGMPPDFAMPVEAEPVKVDTMVRAIRAVGSLRSNESVVITTEVAGKVAQILVNEGQRVTRGTPVVQLDNAIAQAEFAQARARILLSQQNFSRAQELQNRGAGTSKALDEAASALRTDEANLALYQARLDKTRIVAPFDGTLGLRQVSVGRYLNPGDAIITLEQTDPIKVDFRVPEIYLTSVSGQQKLDIELDALPGRKFTGEVYAIDPAVDAAGRSIVIRARVPNADGALRPGLFARVSLIVSKRDNAILVPERALFAFGDDQMVYRIVDGKAVSAKVKLGDRRNADVEILEGLSAGDNVIVDGQMKVRPGAPVRAINQQPPAGAAPPAKQG